MYNCNCMCPIKSTSAIIRNGNLRVTFPNTEVPLQNCDTLSFIICQPIPEFTEIGDVYFCINNINIHLQTRFGNFVKTDQIRCRKKYCVGFGEENSTMVMLTCLPKTSAEFLAVRTEEE